jgi:hypothetical protein
MAKQIVKAKVLLASTRAALPPAAVLPGVLLLEDTWFLLACKG